MQISVLDILVRDSTYGAWRNEDDQIIEYIGFKSASLRAVDGQVYGFCLFSLCLLVFILTLRLKFHQLHSSVAGIPNC